MNETEQTPNTAGQGVKTLFQPGPWYNSPKSSRMVLESRLEQLTDGIDAAFSIAMTEQETGIAFICRALQANIDHLRDELRLTLKWDNQAPEAV